MDPKIIFEDHRYVVIEKDAGVTVNRSETTRNTKTLQDWIDNKFKIVFSTSRENLKFQISGKYIIDGYNKLDEFFDRSGIVHRLDKETSGIILVAKDPEAFINLQNQFKSGSVEKKYTALVHGALDADGEIVEPIGRLPWSRTKFGILPNARKATTQYRVLTHKRRGEEVLTLLELTPKTGRTHQIRVHLKHLNRPIFADELYAGRKTARNDRKVLSRHFLHASEISFISPTTGKRVLFSSVLPDELETFVRNLEQD